MKEEGGSDQGKDGWANDTEWKRSVTEAKSYQGPKSPIKGRKKKTLKDLRFNRKWWLHLPKVRTSKFLSGCVTKNTQRIRNKKNDWNTLKNFVHILQNLNYKYPYMMTIYRWILSIMSWNKKHQTLRKSGKPDQYFSTSVLELPNGRRLKRY